MSFQSLPSWLIYMQIANFILTWGTAGYVYWDRRRDAATKRLSGIEGRLQKLEVTAKTPPPIDPRWEKVEKELVEIKAAMKSPSVCSNHERMEKNDVKLFERLDKLHGDMKEMVGGVKGLAATLDLINQHLINGRK